MTRKHYVMIAERIKHANGKVKDGFAKTPTDAVEIVAAGLAEIFEKDNQNFDTVRFMGACGF
jgi:hypothetical protein